MAKMTVNAKTMATTTCVTVICALLWRVLRFAHRCDRGYSPDRVNRWLRADRPERDVATERLIDEIDKLKDRPEK